MGYNNYNRGFEIDEEKAAEFLENAVEKITTEVLAQNTLKAIEEINKNTENKINKIKLNHINNTRSTIT